MTVIRINDPFDGGKTTLATTLLQHLPNAFYTSAAGPLRRPG